MTPREAGFLLLTSRLGNPERRVLTTAQLRELARRMGEQETVPAGRELTWQDVAALGYGREFSQRVVSLLEENDLLQEYLETGRRAGCVPVTRVSPCYPPVLRRRLGLDSPGCLWMKGDPDILDYPAISLVGSRELREENGEFAALVGRFAGERGLTLVSGNARGADKTAQEACLAAGGRVVSVVADELTRHPLRRNLLWLSEDGFDEPFSKTRALSRNRCIHTLGQMVFVAQATLGKGGTWDGTARNLRFGWSPVLCFRDGSDAARELEQMGAYQIACGELEDFSQLSRGICPDEV